MTPAPTAAEVAASLDDEARRVIEEMMDSEHVFPVADIARDAGVSVSTARVILRRFRADGLAEHGPLFDLDTGSPRGSGTWLTTLGLAVRAHLQHPEGADHA